jgi:hypothetical protein
MSVTASENPVCISRPEPPSPSVEGPGDPSEPHPDEPGAPPDAPARRTPDASDEADAGNRPPGTG